VGYVYRDEISGAHPEAYRLRGVDYGYLLRLSTVPGLSKPLMYNHGFLEGAEYGMKLI